jgi:type III pantothenate kinase
MLLLAIDIGNTNISFGIFKGMRLIRRFDIPTKSYSLNKIKSRLARFQLDDCIICSVVPGLTRRLEKDLKKSLSKPAYILGKDLLVPIKNLYRFPKQVGQDRLANAYAAAVKYGAPLIAIDFGTAVSFDVVSKNKEYLGGMILPGLEISLQALSKHTALLPKIKLKDPGEFIGQDTESSMLCGLVHGFAALTDELVIRIKKKIGRNAKVIATGGNITLVARFCKNIDFIEKELTLKGLYFIYENLKKREH